MRRPTAEPRLGAAEAAIASLAVLAGIFVALGEDTEASMFGLAFLGLLIARALGVPRRALLVLAATVAALISLVLLGGFGRSRATSTVAHVLVSALLAWGLAEPVWGRRLKGMRAGSRPAVLTLVAIVVALGAGWEVGEQIADRLLGTGLSLGLADTLFDLLADTAGALIGAVAAARTGSRRRGGARPAQA